MEEFLYSHRKGAINSGVPTSSRPSSSIPIQFNSNTVLPVCASSISSNDSEITITATSEDEESSQIQFKNLDSNRYKDTPAPFSHTLENRFDTLRELRDGSVNFNNMPIGKNHIGADMNKFTSLSSSSSSTLTKVSSNQALKYRVSPKNNRSKSMAPKEKIKKWNDSATLIQKTWKGYYVRNKDPNIQQMMKDIRLNRIEEHLAYFLNYVYSKNKSKMLQKDLNQFLQNTDQNFLEEKNNLINDKTDSPNVNILEPNSHSLITNPKNENPKVNQNYLGKVSSSNQNDPSNTISELKKTCDDLQRQVIELKDSMRGIVEAVSKHSSSNRSCDAPHITTKTNFKESPLQSVSKITLFSDKKTKNIHNETSSSLNFLANFESLTFDLINKGENVTPDNSNKDSLRFNTEIIQTKNSAFQSSTTLSPPMSSYSNILLEKNYAEIQTFVNGLVEDIINASLQMVEEFEASKINQNMEQISESFHLSLNSSNKSPTSFETTDTYETFPIISGEDPCDHLDIFLNQINVDSSESSN